VATPRRSSTASELTQSSAGGRFPGSPGNRPLCRFPEGSAFFAATRRTDAFNGTGGQQRANSNSRGQAVRPSRRGPAPGRRRAADLQDKQLPPLTATKTEAEQIKALLPETRVLSGAEATEAATKQVSRPRILHIATHGFFMENRPDTSNVENPLLRSGLFLAGANRRQSGAGEDGVLTALEVAGMDLWGTRLVVLSACDTGVGDTSHGEGVYGLRRALVLAGVESQVLTLWQVQDKRTRDLMIDFYRRLQNGEGRTEALRQAQLAMLRGKGVLSRHPFFWAGFLQSGDWRAINGR